MDRNFRRPARDEADASPPSESWLFAQALLGKPIPNPASARAEARVKREQLEWLASFSTEHEAQLRKLQRAEAEARRQRERLEWLAQISTEHEAKLRRLQAEEYEAQEAQQRWAHYYQEYSANVTEWNEVDHPRGPKGTPDGGQWVTKGGGSGSSGATDKSAPTSTSGQRKVVDQHSAPPRMLELAATWQETNDLLNQCRLDIERLPARIANEQAQLGSGGRYAYLHMQNLVKTKRDLETAKALTPQLEAQLLELKQEYDASGYNAFEYATWTPSETRASGHGIEAVGRAVAQSGSPAGVKPTGIEFDIALAAPAVLQLGRAVLARALSQSAKTLETAVDEFVAQLPRKPTPTTTPASLYEARHTGPYNYTVSGGGAKFDIDGYRGTTILEAKHVDKPLKSPFVPGSSIPDEIRAKVLNKVRGGLTKIDTIIKSRSTPFKSVEIITNSPAAKNTFEGMLKELSIPGNVRIEP